VTGAHLQVLAGGRGDYLIEGERGTRFIAARLARHLRAIAPIAKGGEALYVYRDGAYRPGGEEWIRARVVEALEDDWTRRRADEVVGYLRDSSPALDRNPPLDVINCRNGLLDLNTGRLQPHTPDLLSCVQIAADYEPRAKCPAIDVFLGEVLPPDARATFLEFAGYLTTPDTSMQRAVMLLGPGANGKSVALHLLTSLIGVDNVSNVPLHKLEDDRFAVASLYGRLANIFSDLDARALRSSSAFKAIVGGDRMDAERKFRPAFSFHPYARLLFSANAAPPTSDSTEGFFRRWLIFPFDAQIPAEQRDPHLLDKLTTRAELAGLLNRALEGLAALRSRGRFDDGPSLQHAAAEFRTQVDSVSGFIHEECATGTGHQIPKPRLARAYREWCATNGRSPLSTARFNERLRALHPDLTEATVHGVRMWRGITTNGGDA